MAHANVADLAAQLAPQKTSGEPDAHWQSERFVHVLRCAATHACSQHWLHCIAARPAGPAPTQVEPLLPLSMSYAGAMCQASAATRMPSRAISIRREAGDDSTSKDRQAQSHISQGSWQDGCR